MNAERRALVRYAANFPVQLKLPVSGQQELFTVAAVNVSNSSLEIGCKDEVFNCLQTQEGFPYVCDLEFALPDSEDFCTMPCTVLRFRRLSQHSYQIVLDFTQELPIPAASLALKE